MQAAGDGATGPELGSTGVRRAVGASALLVACVVLAWPVVRSRLAPRRPMPISMPAETSTPALAEAQASVDHLQAASAALAKAANEVLTSRTAAGFPGGAASANGAAPPSGSMSDGEPLGGFTETNEATRCLESLVPRGTFGTGRLDWVCEQSDVWQLQLDLYGRAVSRGTGRGVPLWVQLARFELGAIAILRGACCPDAPALLVQVPTERCGVPSDALIALGRDPSAEQVELYADTMQCLADRKVWFPEAWAQVSPRESRRAFDDFLDGARPVLNGRATSPEPAPPRQPHPASPTRQPHPPAPPHEHTP